MFETFSVEGLLTFGGQSYYKFNTSGLFYIYADGPINLPKNESLDRDFVMLRKSAC